MQVRAHEESDFLRNNSRFFRRAGYALAWGAVSFFMTKIVCSGFGFDTPSIPAMLVGFLVGAVRYQHPDTIEVNNDFIVVQGR